MKILHAADLHLDSPFQALDRERAAQRRAEQRGLLMRIGDIARQAQADIAVFAGDLFDSDAPFTETAQLLGQVLSALPMPVFIAPGNHDWYGPRSPWARMDLGENVHVFTDSAVRCIELSDLNARIWGAAFTGRSRAAPLTGFEAPKDIDGVDIMLLHGEVGAPQSVYGPITEEELARSGMDYVALGHVHSFSGLRRAGYTYYAWPGCSEGRGFDETGVKGVILADVSRGACELEFIPVAGRRYEVLSVDITNSVDDYTTILSALPGDMRRDICRLTLTGQTSSPPDVAALSRALESRFFAFELRDGTTLRRDVWAGMGTDSLQGLFLTRLYSMHEASTDAAEKERIIKAARWGIRAMEKGEELTV